MYHICFSMLEDIQEHAMLKTTSSVMQDFVHHHEELINDSSMQTLISQFDDLQVNVQDISTNVRYIGEALTGGEMQDVTNWDDELEAFLKEENVDIDKKALVEVPVQVQSTTVEPTLDSKQTFQALFINKPSLEPVCM